MRDTIKDWIKLKVGHIYDEIDLDASIQAFEHFLKLNKDSINWENVYVEMMMANDFEKPMKIRNFAAIESFMKALCNLTQPGRMEEPPVAIRGNSNKVAEWTLKYVYKDIYNITGYLNEENIERYKSSPGYRYYYLLAYQFRNRLTHQENPDMSNLEEKIQSYIIVELDLCNRYADKLRSLVSAQARNELFERSAFAEKIISGYKKLCKDGFSYIDIHWISKKKNANSSIKLKVEELVLDSGYKYVKLLGEAGTGKSTALKQIEYIMAEKYKADKMLIPIYIEMGKLAGDRDIVLKKIAETMKVEAEKVTEFLKAGEICLLLDGYNEILDINDKQMISRELNDFIHLYPSVRIFLSDRNLAQNTIPTLSEACEFGLERISMDSKLEYFEKYCKDDECMQLITKQMEERPDYFEELDTPLKLKQFLEVVLAKQEIPEDITGEYIEALFKRELEDKQDANISYLNDFLQALALIDQEEIPKLKALSQMAKCKERLGYTTPDTLQCLKLAIDMGVVLELENNKVSFISEQYRLHFLMSALEQGMDDTLA